MQFGLKGSKTAFSAYAEETLDFEDYVDPIPWAIFGPGDPLFKDRGL